MPASDVKTQLIDKFPSYLKELECDETVISKVTDSFDTVRFDELGISSRDYLMLGFFIEEDFSTEIDTATFADHEYINNFVDEIVVMIEQQQ